jgi:hypothetical protein
MARRVRNMVGYMVQASARAKRRVTMKLYDILDDITAKEREVLGIDSEVCIPLTIKARVIDEFRAPKEGEWFIAGVLKGAYRAKYDFISPYEIAELLKIER